MAKPKSEGFPYCQQDTDTFKDPKIRTLISRFGCDGYAVWDYIKQAAFGENGYYVEWDDDRQELASADLYISVEKTGLIVAYLLKRSLLISKSFNGITVLTSHGIQKRFQEMAKSAHRDYYNFRPEIWILSEEETLHSVFCTQNQNNSGIKPFNSGIKADNSGIIRQKKRKEKYIPPISPKGTGGGDREEFFKTYPRLSLGGLNDDGIDYSVLLDRFARSSRLRDTYSMRWIIENYEGICGGLFRDVQAPSDLRAERESWYSIRRASAEDRADHAKREAEQIPGFMEIETELREIDIEEAKAEVEGDETRLKQIRERKGTLRDQRKLCLMMAGMTEEDLLPKYHCRKCSDTGFLPDGTLCDCYEKERK